MTELIDKRELLNALNEESMKHHKSTIPMVEHDFRELINNMPTVDAVPVVRCKDCKWYKGCYMLENKDGYCSEGERKDGTK